ncbi:Metastasis-associated protein MTA1 [Armadillidium vulgare]|nr:Metastasis-associated protein MTA1 [Armadillidium vulgare]
MHISHIDILSSDICKAKGYYSINYVYFETSSTSPYQIRRIEELNKTPNGNVEAKVMCFYRRRDVSSSLIILADKHQKTSEIFTFFFIKNYKILRESEISDCFYCIIDFITRLTEKNLKIKLYAVILIKPNSYLSYNNNYPGALEEDDIEEGKMVLL